MLLALAFALATEPPPPPIVNGDTTRDYPQVVTLFAANTRGAGYNFCSGTLVNEEWVLTAAHCVEGFEDLRSDGLTILYIIAGYDLNRSSGITVTVEADDWIAHEGYDDRALVNDIGMIHLSEPITDFDIMPVNKDSVSGSWVGDDLRYVGWGITDDTATDSSLKHTADIPVADYDSYTLYGYDPDDDQNVCSGDSGGAGLEILGSSAFELAAVNSYVFSPDGDSTPCDGGATGGVRVDRYISWIEGFTEVYSYDEWAAGDAGGSGGSSGGTDTDTSGGTDTDTSGGSSGSADEGNDEGVDSPDRPASMGENYSSEKAAACAVAGGPISGAGLLGLAGLLALRRRRV